MHSEALMNDVNEILQKTKSLLQKAEASNQYNVALNGIGQWRQTLQFVTDLMCRLKELELEERKSDEPLRIRVTLEPDDDENYPEHEPIPPAGR